MWLEINNDNIIEGVHSHQCSSNNTWVEYEGDKHIVPGDYYIKGKVIPAKDKQDIKNKDVRIRLCEQHIKKYYPLTKQVSLLRKGSDSDVQKMNAFIERCEDWLNSRKQELSALHSITP